MTSDTTIMAGVARTIITPPKGIYLIGYGDRSKTNTGVHDELTATALVLDDGNTRIGIVALDILTINEFIVDRIRDRLAPIEVVLCCSHTHSGPIAYADEKSPRKNQKYINKLVNRVVDAVKRAEKHLSPVRLEYSIGESSVGINRREKMPDGSIDIGRNPDGPRDGTVQVVSIFSATEKNSSDQEANRLATIVNYACHGTVLGPDNLLVSADWIGAMRPKIESELGGLSLFLSLFLQGATADINPDMYWEDSHAFEMVSKQGSQVAEAVFSAISTSSQEFTGTPLRIDRTEIWLPTETQVTSDLIPQNYRKVLVAMANMPSFMSMFTDRLLDKRYPWKSVIEDRDGFWSVPMRINLLRIGDLAIVTYAAETFTEIGMKVKSASPAEYTLFASVSDGCISYLHTAESHNQGGYEVDIAPLAYRYPGRLQAVCEIRVLDATAKQMERLWH
jgi:hypothetical protein